MRQLNLVFLLVLVVGMALFGGGMHLVHGIQVRRNAAALLDRARRAEADQQLAKAQDALGWYLSLRPDDGPVWAWYARLVDQGDAGRRRLERTFLIHEQALRHAPDDRELKRRCADLAMEMHRFGDARRVLDELLKDVAGDSKGTSTDAARAELAELLGQCDRSLGQHGKAQESFELAIKLDPHRVDAYDRLARLLRTELRRVSDADDMIQAMIVKNPDSGRAHAYRWRYAQEFAPPADPKDLEEALKRAPDDREGPAGGGHCQRAEAGQGRDAGLSREGAPARSQGSSPSR